MRENDKSAEMETDRTQTDQRQELSKQGDRNSKALFFQQSQSRLAWQLKPTADSSVLTAVP